MLQKIQMESCKINWGGNQTEWYAGLLFDLWAELKGFFKNTKNVGRRNWYVLLWPATSSSASGGEALQGWERKKEKEGKRRRRRKRGREKQFSNFSQLLKLPRREKDDPAVPPEPNFTAESVKICL